MVRRVLIDIRSLVNLVTLEIYKKLRLKRNDLTKVTFPLVGLGDKIILVAGTTNLTIALGNEVFKWSIYAKFIIADTPLSYNVILGRLILNDNNILINVDCLCMKLLAPGGIAMVRKSQKSTQECYKYSIKAVAKVTLSINLLKKLQSNISSKPAY
ncbi:hypothetical protein P3X46_032223 [Hevea brasiliensis]|uniref:Uncharacterized protein n=1 Tax=Hevea brasiliensis TaxID=3981 RepID=A0ABQ9KCR1_HEVBR|nr:hypothetical protein P3X46_032223 [Hevea brasiliensis]